MLFHGEFVAIPYTAAQRTAACITMAMNCIHTCTNVDTTCMGEPGQTNRRAGRPRLARLTVRECPLVDLSSCYNSDTNTPDPPIALLGSIFFSNQLYFLLYYSSLFQV